MKIIAARTSENGFVRTYVYLDGVSDQESENVHAAYSDFKKHLKETFPNAQFEERYTASTSEFYIKDNGCFVVIEEHKVQL